jgi:hypothetical protein
MQKTCHTVHATAHTKRNNSTCKLHANKRMTLLHRLLQLTEEGLRGAQPIRMHMTRSPPQCVR